MKGLKAIYIQFEKGCLIEWMHLYGKIQLRLNWCLNQMNLGGLIINLIQFGSFR